MDNQAEIWKSHPEYTEIEVSTLGRVRTFDRVVSNGKGTYVKKGHVLKQCENGYGYLQVSIKVDGKWTTKRVHRIVAETFIPNPNGFPMVNHKDCNTKNNNVENLEFCTASYNSKYREEFGKALSNPVFAINLSTLEVSRFKSQCEASRKLGIFQPSVNAVIKGKRKQTGGYWIVNDDDNAIDIAKRKLREIGKTKLASSDEAIAEFTRQVISE